MALCEFIRAHPCESVAPVSWLRLRCSKDLVFYNFILKCFLLIDLKIGRLNHRDVGQMDGYVRPYEDQFKVPGDNPTIGLILCSDKGEAVAKYSVLTEGRRIFASKYLQFLPSEEELRLEMEKERRLIEAAMEE